MNQASITFCNKTVRRIKKQFLVLNDWQAVFISFKSPYNDQSVVNARQKSIAIYPPKGITDAIQIENYILHEILHAVLEASKLSKLHDEQAVCDIMALFTKKPQINHLWV